MTSQSNTISKVFGAGDVYALVQGLTPVKFGVLQDIEIDISGAVAELYGQYQFPVAAARGKGKISGKAKMGQFDVNLFNSIYYGGAISQGTYNKEVTNEAHTAGASAPTTTATLSSGGITDLGVYYSATGVQLTYSTAAAPTIGNYAVVPATGVYTVSTAEASSTPFLLNYAYPETTGNQLVVSNQLMGIQPVFELRMYEGFTDFAGRTNFDIKLNRCISTKMNFPFKNSDFMVADFEFSAFADSTGGLFTLGTGV